VRRRWIALAILAVIVAVMVTLVHAVETSTDF
jgi:hypothetical protein